MERGFSPLKVVDGLDLFEPERTPAIGEVESAFDLDERAPQAKVSGARDAQKKKKK
jgi:hypothetical protein